MVDLGTGNNNKINWAMNDKQEFIDIVETVYRGARKGRGLVVSPKGEKKEEGITYIVILAIVVSPPNKYFCFFFPMMQITLRNTAIKQFYCFYCYVLPRMYHVPSLLLEFGKKMPLTDKLTFSDSPFL